MASYIVVKHSWKGKYKRVLVIEPNQLSTFDPKTMKLTNCWPYDEVLDVAPLNGDLFKLVTRKKTGNTDLLKFSSEFRKDILCDIIRFRPNSFQTEHGKYPPLQYECSKFHWTRQELPAILDITANAIVQTDTLGNAHAFYYFKHIGHISLTSNPPGCICISMNDFGRLHLFRLTNKLKSNIRDPDGLVDDFVKSLQTYAVNNCGISFLVKKDPIEINQFYSLRFGPKYSTDEALTSLHEFTVYKLHQRHGMRPIRRILCITNLALVERNPDTYQPITIKPLHDIFSMLRSADDPQVFSIEFAGLEKTFSYTSTERDALLASLVESVRSSGNVDVHVKITPTNLSWRCGPLHVPVDDEIERGHLKAFVALPLGWTFLDAIYRFNTICPYSGLAHNSAQDVKLFSENKAKLIVEALKSFLEQTEDGGIPMFYAQDNNNIQQARVPADIEQYYQALRRLVASKPGYAFFNQSERFRAYLGASIVETIKLNNDAITYAGFDVLCALMQPMHPDCDIRHEQLNKSSLLATKKFLESLLDVLKLHINRGTGALVVSSMLDFLTYALCAPYSETTDSSCFDTLLNLIASNGRDIYKLFQHPSLAIVKGAGLVIKAIILEGDPNVSKRMQELSLAEGALMKHFHIGLFSQFKDGRTLGVQYLSRHLVALWSIGSDETKDLFRRMFPLGLLNYLDSTEKPPQSMISMPARDNLQLANQTSPMDSSITNTLNSIKDMHPSVRILERQLEQTIMHWREQIGMPKRDERLSTRPVVLRKCRQRVKVEDNWDMFYYQFYQDHCKPDLIWNLKTREELKTVIENELRQFMTDRELAAKQTLISWNYHEFEVSYKSLADEIRIGDYFLRLLLEDSDNLMQRIQIKSPFHFLSDLYHRFLLNKRVDMRCTCLHAMSIIYENYMQEIGHFNDIIYIVEMLQNCRNRTERDRLILLLEKFVMHKTNAKDFIDAGGVTTLVDMVTLAHLHTQRAFIPTQTNVIEATTEMLAAAASKEWYYSNDEKLLTTERPDEDISPQDEAKLQSHQGPFRFAEIEELWKDGKVNEKTKFWSQGMNGWKYANDISQMKWCILASGNPMMNESELATCIMNIFIQICEYYPSHDLDGAIIRPFPRIKKYLSDAACLPHIVQLLVTFDPVIVERVSTLLLLIIEENPMISQLYRSGLFFFILMYSGSNLIPIGRLLHATHLAQAYRMDESSKTKLKSFLTYLLPEAMVCFLENHGPDRFAQIFLGEFDTPEAIWNGEMRRTMIEKIACHVADFTSRLKSNNRATYDYCPIAPITYDQLEDELFVDIYYLRNLCNTSKFQHWPIKDPVNLLKALLDAWKEEISREPSTLSLEDALKVLRLNPDNYKHPEDIDEQTVKRAYRDLALKYHPDKNPDGAHIFQEIHKAYEFLSSKQARERASGSNPKNLILIFKSQSILFSQCSDELHPYKYSGYPMLIDSIKNEVEDDRLFSKSDPILAYACETAYHTLRCSAKNAEELRREAGLEILQQALSRCASVLSGSSNPDDVCVQMCTNIVKCFTVAAEFEACQQKLSELHSVVKDLNRILSYGVLLDLQIAAVECAAAFAKCPPLHELLFQSGIVFSLLLLLFKYDYTLEEGGVERNEGHNKQDQINNIAKIALYACVRLYELNPALYGRSIEAMLSHYVASFFIEANLNPHELLKMLTSNVEIPYLIWNNSTRAELVDYLEAQQKGIIQSGECPDESYGADFEITSHKSELRVGNIFIKIYNSQPSYPLRDAAGFVQALLNYVGDQSQYIHSALSLSNEVTLDTNAFQNVECCLKALALAIKFNPGVEVKCIGYFKLLFSLLMINQLPNVQDMALHVIKNITSNGQCVNDIGNSDVLVYLWMILYTSRSSLATTKTGDQSSSPTKRQVNDKANSSDTISNIYHDDDPVSRTMLILDILLPLIANAQLVKETISKGGLVYLVDLFCNCTDEAVRLRSSDLMARVTVDKLSGFQASLILNRFLPMIIVDAMKNSAKDSLGLFDNNQENPELIWNTEMRQHIKTSTSKLSKEIFEEQVKNPDYCWQMPQDFNLLNATNQEELVVAGVYLRLFNQNPTWVLRKPRDFLTELMNTFQAMIKSATIDQEKLETVGQALKNLLSAQPALLELIPAMGHVHSIVAGIYSKSNKNELVSKSCLTILSELGSSRACVDNMSTRDSLLNEIKSSMVNIPETVDIACFGLRKIYEFSPVNDRVVQQALEANFITYLLEVLNSNHSAQTRALIVKILKSMTKNQTYGPQVETILGKSQTWSEYSDQKHDLFISNEPSLVAIAAPTANIAGYLQYNTQSPAQPPPVDK